MCISIQTFFHTIKNIHHINRTVQTSKIELRLLQGGTDFPKKNTGMGVPLHKVNFSTKLHNNLS